MEPLMKDKKPGVGGTARPSEAAQKLNGGFGHAGRSTPFGDLAAPDRLEELGPPKVMYRYTSTVGREKD